MYINIQIFIYYTKKKKIAPSKNISTRIAPIIQYRYHSKFQLFKATMNFSAASSPPVDTDDIIFEVPGFIRRYRNGRVERLIPDELVPPSLDPATGVQSKDVTINPTTSLSVRLYLPPSATSIPKKLPVLVTIHGGGFYLLRSSSSSYHNYVNSLTAKAGVLAISIDYRLAPENPLPAAYEDCWEALEWVFATDDPWLSNLGDLENVYIAGESAGGNLVHSLGIRLGREGRKVEGLVMVHPLFWGKDRIGDEGVETRKGGILTLEHIDALWPFVCPETTGFDDPRINPVAEGAPSLATLGCRRVLVCVAELDLLRERGRLYYEKLKESDWEGDAEILESENEDHGFFFFNPGSLKAQELTKRIVNFFNKS
ncbi:putative carboxylesterase 2 [Dendrobium catenatum]|uniref:Putative carboxylesterase 2 n=2 Tax=Dendrobium catenatum TaxID=906689 RepID=A0A2I0XHW1_9ASPA|nr:putative carboxylesterase 2 [Dendrobium catenatum]